MTTNAMRIWQREHLSKERGLIVEDELLVLDFGTAIKVMICMLGLASDRQQA